MRAAPRTNHGRGRLGGRVRGDAASASRSWFRSSCFLNATETRSAWSIAQLWYVGMEMRAMP